MLDEDELQALYQWVDEIPLSRPKRNIARDFSDGVLMAELVKYYFPRLVELHNYSPSESVPRKVYNWETLEKKVFRKLTFALSKADIQEVAECAPGAVEKVLSDFHKKLTQIQHKKAHEQQQLRQQRGGGGATDPEGGGAVSLTNPGGAYAAATHGPSHQAVAAHTSDLTHQIIAEKDETIKEMKETIDILEVKIQKLEQLVKIKDQKISVQDCFGWFLRR